MAIAPDEPQSIGRVLDTTFQLYKAALAKVWLICLIGAVGNSLPGVYPLVTVLRDPMSPVTPTELMWSPGYWFVTLAGIGISLWMLGALYLKLHSIGVDAEIGIGAAMRAAVGRVPVLLVMMILLGIALLAGFLLLIIPGLVLMVSLMLCFNLALFEGKGPIASLTGSHQLVWGNWWRTSAIMGVVFIAALVIYAVIALAASVIMPLDGVDVRDLVMQALLSATVVSVVVSAVVTPLYAALLIALYWDLKLRGEGGDRAAPVGALAGG